MRRIAATVLAGSLALVLGACGDDGGGSADPELVELLRDETGQSEEIARCIAERVEADDDVDREALEAIIRGEGTDDLDTANAYGDAALECAQEVLGDVPGLPDDLTDGFDLQS